MFSLSEEEALETLRIREVIIGEPPWAKGRLSTSGIILKNILMSLMLISGIAMPYYFAKIASRSSTKIAAFTLDGTLSEFIDIAYSAFIFIYVILLFYAWITAFLYRRKNHVKYIFHFSLMQVLIMFPFILSLHLFAMLFMPNIFPFFRTIVIPILTLILIYDMFKSIYSSASTTLKRTFEIFDGDWQKKAKIYDRVYMKYLLWFSGFVLIGLLIRGVKLSFLLSDFWGMLLPVLFIAVLFMSQIFIDMTFSRFLKNFYLLRYSEAFRTRAQADSFAWYGYKCMKDKWVRNKLTPEDLKTYSLGQGFQEATPASDGAMPLELNRNAARNLGKLDVLRLSLSLIILCFLALVIFAVQKGYLDNFYTGALSENLPVNIIVWIFFSIILLYLFIRVARHLWRNRLFASNYLSGKMSIFKIRKALRSENFSANPAYPKFLLSENYLLIKRRLKGDVALPYADIESTELRSNYEQLENPEMNRSRLIIYTKHGDFYTLEFLNNDDAQAFLAAMNRLCRCKFIVYPYPLQHFDWQKDYSQALTQKNKRKNILSSL